MSPHLAAMLATAMAFGSSTYAVHTIRVLQKISGKVSLNLIVATLLTFAVGIFNLIEIIYPFQTDLSVTGTTACSFLIIGMLLFLIVGAIPDDE